MSPPPASTTSTDDASGERGAQRDERAREEASAGGESAQSGDRNDESFSYAAELKRKALHILALVVPLGMGWLGTDTSLALLLPVTALAVTADVLRAYSDRFSRFIRWIFGPLMRATELPPVGTGVVLNGATCVLVGATLLTLFFPIDVAAPTFAMVMIADAAAALVGRRFGRHRWPGSTHTVEGSLAFVVSGLAVVALAPSVPFGIAAVGVVTAAVVEAWPLPLNDNIRVPLAAALVVTLAQIWLLGQPVTWGAVGGL